MADDAQVVARFEIEFGDHAADLVAESVSGMGYRVEYTKNNQADGTFQMVPTYVEWEDLVITYKITAAVVKLWDWRKAVTESTAGARTNGTIKALNSNNEVIGTWNVENAWPREVSGPDMDTYGTGFMTGQIVIVHEGVERAQ